MTTKMSNPFDLDNPYEAEQQLDDLQYREEVTARLVAALEEYLSFSTMRDLIKLIVAAEL